MKNQTKFKGTTINLFGAFPKAGSSAPDFTLVKQSLGDFTLSECGAKRIVLNVFPSLDTGVCAASVRRFNRMASLMKDTLVLCISRDLPFAHSRFCVAENIKNVVTLSDIRPESNFAKDYGVLIESGDMRGLLARAVFVIDENRKFSYCAIIDDIVHEPNYDEILKVL